MALKCILILYIVALFTTCVFSDSYSYINFRVPKAGTQKAALITIGDIELSDDKKAKLTPEKLQVFVTIDGSSKATQDTFSFYQTASWLTLKGTYTKDSAIISYFRFKTLSKAPYDNPTSVAATVGCRVFGESFTGSPQPTALVNFFFPSNSTCKQATGVPLTTTMVLYSQMKSSSGSFAFSYIQLLDVAGVAIDAADVKITAYGSGKECTTDDPLKPASKAQTCPENVGYVFELTKPNVTVTAIRIFPPSDALGTGDPLSVFISMSMDSPEVSYDLDIPKTPNAFGLYREIKF